MSGKKGGRGVRHPAHIFARKIESMRFSTYFIKGLVLDAGCGDGRFAKNNFKGTIVGLDYLKEKLELAKYRLSHVVLGDLRKMPFKENIFDFAVSNSTIEHVNSCEKALEEIYRTSKNLLLSAPSNRASKVIFIDNFFGMINKLSLKEWELSVRKAGFQIKKSFYYMPLVSQFIYYFSLLVPICIFLPDSILKKWSASRQDGVMTFIWGAKK